jgi:hypothetical protein
MLGLNVTLKAHIMGKHVCLLNSKWEHGTREIIY